MSNREKVTSDGAFPACIGGLCSFIQFFWALIFKEALFSYMETKNRSLMQ